MKIIYAAVTALGIATLVNGLTQTVCAQLSLDKTSLIAQMAPGGFYNRGGGGFNPGGNFYNRGGGFNPGGNFYNRGGGFNPGGNFYNQGGGGFNPGGNFYNQGGGGFNPGNFYNQGPDRFSQQNYRREIQDLTQVIHKNPNFVEAYNNRALARFVLGDKQGAIADLKQAASLYLKRGNRAKYQQTLLSIRELQY